MQLLSLAARTLHNHWSKWTGKHREIVDTFWKEWAKKNWFYRLCAPLRLFSVATNNGTEGTNLALKKEFTKYEQSTLYKSFLLSMQMIEEASTDPEKQVLILLLYCF